MGIAESYRWDRQAVGNHGQVPRDKGDVSFFRLEADRGERSSELSSLEENSSRRSWWLLPGCGGGSRGVARAERASFLFLKAGDEIPT